MTEVIQDVTAPVDEFARRIRSQFGESCRRILLFGSRARGTARPDSDFDMMILVDRATDEVHRRVQDIAFEMALEFDSAISPVVFEARQYESDRYEPLFVNVRREGIAV
jgi:predicted nucleotidyltransferase